MSEISDNFVKLFGRLGAILREAGSQMARFNTILEPKGLAIDLQPKGPAFMILAGIRNCRMERILERPGSQWNTLGDAILATEF